MAVLYVCTIIAQVFPPETIYKEMTISEEYSSTQKGLNSIRVYL